MCFLHRFVMGVAYRRQRFCGEKRSTMWPPPRCGKLAHWSRGVLAHCPLLPFFALRMGAWVRGMDLISSHPRWGGTRINATAQAERNKGGRGTAREQERKKKKKNKKEYEKGNERVAQTKCLETIAAGCARCSLALGSRRLPVLDVFRFTERRANFPVSGEQSAERGKKQKQHQEGIRCRASDTAGESSSGWGTAGQRAAAWERAGRGNVCVRDGG